MYQEVCFSLGPKQGGERVNVGHSLSPPPPPSHFMLATGLDIDLCCEVHFACDFCTALEILAFTLEEFVKGEKNRKVARL